MDDGRTIPQPAAVKPSHPTVQLVVENQGIDPLSHQFQCAVRLENNGDYALQILSLHVSNPIGTSLQGGPVEINVDVEPGDHFSRIYVFNCQRYYFNSKTYTFTFECTFKDSGVPDNASLSGQKHLSESVAAVITGNPFTLSVLAVASAILGAILQLLLQAQAASTSSQTRPSCAPSFVGSLPYFIHNLPPCVYESIGEAMITALIFYNIYDATSIGKKLNVGNGWRSALIIGGLSGLFNDRVIAALNGLLSGA